MLELVAIILLVAAALAILVWVAAYGLRRAMHLRRFAEQRDGSYSEFDEFGLTEKLGRFEAADGRLPGRAARLPAEPETIYLFDLVAGDHAVSACLVETDARRGDFTLTSRFPRPDTAGFAASFELVPPEALSTETRDRLVEATGEFGWILSAWRRGPSVLVRVESRRLQRDEWEAFVRLTCHLARSQPSSPSK